MTQGKRPGYVTVYDQAAVLLRQQPYTCEALATALGRPVKTVYGVLHYFDHHLRFQLRKKKLLATARGERRVYVYWLADQDGSC